MKVNLKSAITDLLSVTQGATYVKIITNIKQYIYRNNNIMKEILIYCSTDTDSSNISRNPILKRGSVINIP